MHCPFCDHADTRVTDSRLAGDGRQIRRRRECLDCGERFTTFEAAELLLPRVIKGDGSREPFDEAKLTAGMVKALEKRPVGSEAIEAAVARICHRLRVLGEREVPSRQVGELVMEELRHLDEVAYVRFASVYRSFQDVEAFRETIDGLRKHRRRRERDRTEEREQLPLLPGEPRRTRQGKTMIEWSTADEQHMRHALGLAALGLNTTDPNPRVGCVLVRDGAIVGEGWHERAGGPHAEVCALQSAGAEARGATAYVSLEPCAAHGRTPPCTAALLEAGVARVVYAVADPNPQMRGGGAVLREAGMQVDGWPAGGGGARTERRVFQPLRAKLALGAGQAGRQPGRPHRARQRREPLDHRSAGPQRRPTLSRPQFRGAHRFGHGACGQSDPQRAHRGGRSPAAARGAGQPFARARRRRECTDLKRRQSCSRLRRITEKRESLQRQGVRVEGVAGSEAGLDLQAVMARLAALGAERGLGRGRSATDRRAAQPRSSSMSW